MSASAKIGTKNGQDAAQNFSLLNRIALNLLKQEIFKRGIKGKCPNAAWSLPPPAQITRNLICVDPGSLTDLRINPLRRVTAPESQLFFVGQRIVIPQPQEPIERVDGGLHQVLHLIVRDVGDLDFAATRRARTSSMQLFDGSVTEGQSGQRFHFSRKFQIECYLHERLQMQLRIPSILHGARAARRDFTQYEAPHRRPDCAPCL
jgi:hypothetical protein